MSAVLAPLVAAATEEEVGCLWSLGQGAPRLVGVLSALECPTVSMPGGMENWKAESVFLGSLYFPRPGPRGEAHLSEVFPEARFLWAAQEVVSEWD